MEDTIDWRQYVHVILHWWWLIAICTLLAAGSALAISFVIPPKYEATVVVIITQPRYEIAFDPRFETIESVPAYKAFPRLATSDDVLQETVDAYTPSEDAKIKHWTVHTLAKMVAATSEGDPSLVLLTVESRSPKDASGIVNTWAQVFAEHGRALYNTTQEEVAFFTDQVTQAEEALASTEQALIDFRARDQSSTLAAQLNSLHQTQSDYLSDKRAITYLVRDIQSLRSQLSRQPSDQPTSLADNLTALYLQIKAFNAAASAPIELQVSDADVLSTKSQSEQIAFLDDLVNTLESKSAEIDTSLVELEPQILDLQRQLQEINTENEQLQRAHDLANTTYTTLSRKLEEARIAVQENKGTLQVGSYAAIPEKPKSPQKVMNTALAGTMGLMLSVGGAFAWEWWRGSPPNSPRTKQSPVVAHAHKSEQLHLDARPEN
ncbi:MAG: GumC family protein [Anaerolineae bacterium]